MFGGRRAKTSVAGINACFDIALEPLAGSLSSIEMIRILEAVLRLDRFFKYVGGRSPSEREGMRAETLIFLFAHITAPVGMGQAEFTPVEAEAIAPGEWGPGLVVEAEVPCDS